MEKKLEKYNYLIDKVSYIVFAFYLTISIFAISSICYGNTSVEFALKLCRYFCYGIFLIRIIYKYGSLDIPELLIILLGILITIFSFNPYIFILSIILSALKSLDSNKLYKISLYVILSCFSVIVLLSFLKVIPNWTYLKGDITRNSLGFFYPTDCFSVYLLIVLLIFYAKKFDISYLWLIIIEAVNIILYYYTYGRLSFILINLIILVIVLGKIPFIKRLVNKDIFKLILKYISYTLPVTLFLITNLLIIGYKYQVPVVNKIDDVLSNRISYSYEAHLKNKITIFGQELKWNGWGGYGYTEASEDYEYNFVDNSYSKILLEYGIVLTIVVLALYTYLLIRCYKDKNWVLFYIILFVLIWSFIEPYIVDIGRNVFVIELIMLFKSRGKMNEEVN